MCVRSYVYSIYISLQIHFQEFLGTLYPRALDLISQSVEARQGCCVLAGSTFYFEKIYIYYVLYIGLTRPADIPTNCHRYIDKMSERAKRAAGRAAKPHAPPSPDTRPPAGEGGPLGDCRRRQEKINRFGLLTSSKSATKKCGDAKQNSKHCEQPYWASNGFIPCRSRAHESVRGGGAGHTRELVSAELSSRYK